MNKIADLIELQNKISHYNHINDVKSTIKNNHTIQNKHNSRFHNKFYHSIQRERKIENHKLLDKLLEIHKKKPSLISQRYSDTPEKSYTMQNKYKIQQKIKQRVKQNGILTEKLKHIKPLIGSQDQWNQHYHFFLQNQKKLSRQSGYRNNETQSIFNSTVSDNFSQKELRRIKIKSENTRRFKIPNSNIQVTNNISNKDLHNTNEVGVIIQGNEYQQKRRSLKKKKKKKISIDGQIIPTQAILKSYQRKRGMFQEDLLNLYRL